MSALTDALDDVVEAAITLLHAMEQPGDYVSVHVEEMERAIQALRSELVRTGLMEHAHAHAP